MRSQLRRLVPEPIKKIVRRSRKEPVAIDAAMAAAQIALTEANKITSIENPAHVLNFFVDCFKPLTFSSVYKTPRFERADRLISFLQISDFPLPLSAAIDIALYADGLWKNYEPESYSGDTGLHFSMASSIGWKARLVFNITRALKPKACFEIGTGYGISTYLIARCQELCGTSPRVVTVEKFEPQKNFSKQFLKKHFPEAVRTVHSDKHDAIAKLEDSGEQFDFVFHDNGHSGDHYVRDFLALLPLMPSGAVFLLDDINWFGHGGGYSSGGYSSRTCYEGWLEIIKHSRVAAALEVSNMGMIFLD